MPLRKKTIVMVIFDSQGEIYTNHVTRGALVNLMIIRTALHRFLKVIEEEVTEY
jgi:hypothetical protein